jgi:seryl-tRNA synthetase
MLDLNYVRENLDRVRAALEARGFPTAALDDFAGLDAERRRVIGESDRLNGERNAAAREIGALMKEGRREEAEGRRRTAAELKERIASLDRERDEAERRMQELLSTVPNVQHESVPAGTGEDDNVEVAGGTR